MNCARRSPSCKATSTRWKPATREDAETLAIAADELARMGRLVDELTVLASSERPDFLRRQLVDVGSFTSSVLAKARLLGDRPWLLTGAATGRAMLDPQRLTQALMQLAANAAAHTPPGTPGGNRFPPAPARCSNSLSPTTVRAYRPVSESASSSASRASNTPRTDGGGLGLSIVGAITAAHGGTVQVADDTRWRCGLRDRAATCRRADIRTDHAVTTREPSREGSPDVSRNLIAEDEPNIVRFLAKGLQAEGHATTPAADGPTALHLAQTGEFDLMLLDLGLPGRDGLDVLTELRRKHVRLPIIVLTARSTTADVVTGLDRGADDYISKPFRLAELLARVRLRLRPEKLGKSSSCVTAT